MIRKASNNWQTRWPWLLVLSFFSPPGFAVEAAGDAGAGGWILLLGIASLFVIVLAIYIDRLKRNHREHQLQLRTDLAEAQAQKTELDAVLANFSDIQICIDRDWRVLAMNEPAAQIANKLNSGFQPFSFEKTFPDLAERAQSKLEESFTKQTAAAFEIHCPKRKRWYEVYTYPRADEMKIYFKDVSQRSEHLARAEDNERRLAAILNNAIDAIITIDDHGLIQTFNLAAEKIFGYRQSEIIGRSINELMPVAEARHHDHYVKSHITTGKTTILGKERELQGRRKNGELFVMEAAVSEVIVSSKRTFIGVLRDVSEKKRAEEKIRRLVAAVEHAADGVFITDVHGHVEYINPAYRNMNGYSRSAHGEIKPHVFSTEESDPKTYSQLITAMQSDEMWTGRYSIDGEDGVHQEEATVSPVRDDAGKLICYVGVCRDITQQVKQEARQRQSEKITALASLAAGIAHQFNNTLATITGYTEVAMLDLKDGDPIIDELKVVLAAADRAKMLVSQMIEFSADDLETDYDFDPSVVTQEIVFILREMLASEAEIQLDSEADIGSINMSPSQYQTMLLALGMNAIRAIEGDPGGIIEVQLSNLEIEESELNNSVVNQAGQYLSLIVSDNGVGINEDALENIFKPFFTTDEGNSNGMGLATVQGIVQSHGGAIDVDSSPNCGARFSVYLPLRSL